MSSDHERSADSVTETVVWVLFAGILLLSTLAFIYPRDASSGVATDGGDSASAEVGDGSGSVDGVTTDGDSDSERFTISASGDVLIHRRVAEAAASGDGFDFTPLFANIKPRVEGADIAICHLEVPLSSTNTDLAYGDADSPGAFRAPNQLADALVDTGFDFCSVASNHAYDSGASSVVSTVEQLTRVGMPHTGIADTIELADTQWRKTVNGVTVGHLSYTYGLNGREGPDQAFEVATINEALILAQASAHRAGGSEFIVVSLHWGIEFDSELTEQQASLGPRLLASPDIDLIIGHHAHMAQRIDEIDGEYIAYGLGNLLSNQSSIAPECLNVCPLESQDGVLVEFVVDRRDDGSLGVVDVQATPTWVDIGTTWEVFDTTASQQISGASADSVTLLDSQNRTMATLGSVARLTDSQ
jgi:hypothetical protein